MADPIVNFFKSTLVGTYSNTDTSLTIATGDGALLPDPSTDGAFNLTIFEGLQVTGSTTFEIVRVTARSGDVLTVTRGAESTTPLTIGSATHSILMSATKKTFDDIRSDIANIDLTTISGAESITFDTTGDEVLQFPVGTTAQRPLSPATGYIRYNSDRESIEFYNGTNWIRLQSVEFNSLELGVATATVSGQDATTLTNVIENAERLTFNSSGDESFTLPSGTEAQRPTGVAGRMRYNTDEDVIEAYLTDWVQIGSSAFPVFFGNRGLFGGGNTGSISNVIDYVAIDTTGNATDFGDLTATTDQLASCSNGTRGLFGGGRISTPEVNKIDFVTIATTGNATDFGDLSGARRVLASCSDGTTGVFAGGFAGADPGVDTIDYVTIDTTGNAQDFGDLTQARYGLAGCSNRTRGVFGGGYATSYLNTIDYITIATPGNAIDFGDLISTPYTSGACSDGSRGVFGGGRVPPNDIDVIQYITIDTTGNATDFGDLTVGRNALCASSNGTRGVFAGGATASYKNTIDYITIQTTGNATDFGDLTVARGALASCSGD